MDTFRALCGNIDEVRPGMYYEGCRAWGASVVNSARASIINIALAHWVRGDLHLPVPPTCPLPDEAS